MLLRACAIAALMAHPTLAAAGPPDQVGDFTAARFSIDRGIGSRRIDDVPTLPNAIHGVPPAGNPETGPGPIPSPPTITGQSATFDVEVEAPATAAEASSVRRRIIST